MRASRTSSKTFTAHVGIGYLPETTTGATVDEAGSFLVETVFDHDPGLQVGGREVLDADDFGRPLSVGHFDGTPETHAYGCCCLPRHTDRDRFDLAGRLVTSLQNGTANATREYNVLGRPDKEVDPDP